MPPIFSHIRWISSTPDKTHTGSPRITFGVGTANRKQSGQPFDSAGTFHPAKTEYDHTLTLLVRSLCNLLLAALGPNYIRAHPTLFVCVCVFVFFVVVINPIKITSKNTITQTRQRSCVPPLGLSDGAGRMQRNHSYYVLLSQCNCPCSTGFPRSLLASQQCHPFSATIVLIHKEHHIREAPFR